LASAPWHDVGKLALQVGRGCAELHDRMMVGVHVNRIECDELWSFVQRKRRQHEKPRPDVAVTGDQYTYVALGASSRAIISYRTGKRDGATTRPLRIRRPFRILGKGREDKSRPLSRGAARTPRLGQQLGKLGYVRRNASRLIARKQLGRRSPAGVVLEIDVGKRLAVVIADNETGVGLLDGPGRRKAACGHGSAKTARL
jgi:hypothetical protein